MSLPALQLALRLDGTDVFGTLEWILANARRTGLSLQQLRFDAGHAGQVARIVAEAPEADLLHLFVRRLSQGVDMSILDADVSAEEPLAA